MAYTFNRYVAVVKPLKEKSFNTSGRARLAIMIIAIIAFVGHSNTFVTMTSKQVSVDNFSSF